MESASPLPYCDHITFVTNFFQLVILYYNSFTFPYLLNQGLYRGKKSRILKSPGN